jgi:general secretion pathway protein F
MLTKFDYHCLDSVGKDLRGNLSAQDVEQAKNQLRKSGMTILSLTERPMVARAKPGSRVIFSRKVGEEELYNTARELSILLKSGITIDRALEIVLRSQSNPLMTAALSEVLNEIRSGKGTAEGFSKSSVFTPLMTTMLLVGESVGNLQTAFESIAEYLRFQIQMKGEIRSALAYPLFLIGASVVTIMVIFQFILPRFFSIFGKDAQASLPWAVKVLHVMAGGLTVNHFLILALVTVGLIVLVGWANLKEHLMRISGYLIYVPLIRNLVIALELSRFSYAMQAMLKSGMEFIKALQLSVGLIQNRSLRAQLAPTVRQVQEGKGIADVFAQVEFLPELVSNMIRVGEESGNLKEIFSELHQVFEERFRSNVKRMLVLIEPIIISVTGLIVGFIVIALILTVMNVGNIAF